MKKYILIFFALFSSSAFAMPVSEIIADIAKYSGVDKKVYYSIIKIESDWESNIVAFNASKEFYNELKPLKKIIGDISLKFIRPNRVVIIADRESIISIAQVLYARKINFDLGLAQINSVNFKENEIPKMFEPKYNLIKANNVLAQCAEYYRISPKSTIECYNKGFRKHRNYAYFQKFLKAYKYYAKEGL